MRLRNDLGGRAARTRVDLDGSLTNIGTRACALRGFPGVSFVAGADGHVELLSVSHVQRA